MQSKEKRHAPHTLPAAAAGLPRPPHESPDDVLAESVSATSVSFVACGAAFADLGELLRDLRLALQVAERRTATPERQRAAALLAARLEAVRWALDGATTAVDGLLADCAPAGAAPRSGRSC